MATKSLVEVGVSMVLQDNFSQQAGKISSSYQSLMTNMYQWNRAITQSVGAAADTGERLVGGMFEAFKHSAEIQNEVFLTSKIAGATAKQTEDLVNRIQEVNRKTPLTNLDIASGAKYLAMAGHDATNIMALLEPASNLASIFSMQLGGKGGVADLMTNVMSTFGIAASDAQKTADILGVATTSANINLTDLAQSLQYSGAVFRNSGVDLSTAAAAIGVLGDQGIQASSAGTALANMLRYLNLSISGAKVKGAKWLEALGLTRDDLVGPTGQLKDLGEVMQVLYSRLSQLDKVNLGRAIYDIFGVRGERAVSALMQSIGSGKDKFEYIRSREADSLGWGARTMEERMKTPQGRLDALRAAIDNLKMGLGQAMTIFTPFMKGITWIANKIGEMASNKGFGAWAIKIGAAVIIANTIVLKVRVLFGVIRMVTTMMGTAATEANVASTGMGKMVSKSMALESHLRTIVALMMEMTALQYAPGTKGMLLPMGGRLGRKVNGRPYVGIDRRSLAPATYATALGAAAGARSMASAGVRAAGQTAARVGMAGRIAGLGRGLFGFLGGWPGIIATGLMTLIPLIIDWVSSSRENTDAVNGNTDALSNAELYRSYQERYLQAVTEAIKAGTQDGELRIKVNGVYQGNLSNTEEVVIDTYNLPQ